MSSAQDGAISKHIRAFLHGVDNEAFGNEDSFQRRTAVEHLAHIRDAGSVQIFHALKREKIRTATEP